MLAKSRCRGDGSRPAASALSSPCFSLTRLCLCADAHHFCKQLSVSGKTDPSSRNKLYGLMVLSLPLAVFGSEAGTQLSSGQWDMKSMLLREGCSGGSFFSKKEAAPYAWNFSVWTRGLELLQPLCWNLRKNQHWRGRNEEAESPWVLDHTLRLLTPLNLLELPRLLCGAVLSRVQPFSGPVDCSPPGPSVRGALQARTLQWAASLLQGTFPTQGRRPRLLHLLAWAGRLPTPAPELDWDFLPCEINTAPLFNPVSFSASLLPSRYPVSLPQEETPQFSRFCYLFQAFQRMTKHLSITGGRSPSTRITVMLVPRWLVIPVWIEHMHSHGSVMHSFFSWLKDIIYFYMFSTSYYSFFLMHIWFTMLC